MRLVDGHCHLDTRRFDDDRDDVVTRARAAGVVGMTVAGSTFKSITRALALAEQYEGVYAAIGVYPRYLVNRQTDVERLRELAQHRGVVALGETGLLYAWDNRCSHEMQQRALQRRWSWRPIWTCRWSSATNTGAIPIAWS